MATDSVLYLVLSCPFYLLYWHNLSTCLCKRRNISGKYVYEESYFPVDPHVSGNAFLWKFSPSTVVVVIGHQRILLCHQCPCIYNQNFLTIHYFLKIVDTDFFVMLHFVF
jgi:hypothetical protein